MRSKAEESKNEMEKRKADIAKAEQMYQVKQRTQWIDQQIKQQSDKYKYQRDLQESKKLEEERKAEGRKKELLKKQLEKRKAEEVQKAKKARDMIEENRRRVQL